MLENVQCPIPGNYEEEENFEWAGDCDDDFEGNVNEELPVPQREPSFMERIRNETTFSHTIPDFHNFLMRKYSIGHLKFVSFN